MQEQLDKRGDGIGQDTDEVGYFLLKKVCNPSPAMIKQTTKKIDCGQNAVASSNIRTRRLFHITAIVNSTTGHDSFPG